MTLLPTFVTDLVSLVAQGAMVFGGVVPFVPQMSQIRRRRSAEGFSTWVCFALLLANILRIYFWFGHPFELPLLAQSVVMVVTMMALLRECVAVMKYESLITAGSLGHTQQHHAHAVRLRGLKNVFIPDRRTFWRWTNFLDYCIAMASISALLGLITYIFLDCAPFVELLGFSAVFTEALLGVPQFMRNHRHKSTSGMR